jgi:uncharacterized RDD family membrane protein YckC
MDQMGCASRQDRFVAREGIRGALSTLPNSAVLFPDWKQEISRRVAAHKSARGVSQDTSVTAAPAHPLGNRAARAASRVAARFATAPTYSEMLAREARAAVDAAKAAAKAAEEAQVAFQFVLDGLEVAGPATPDWQLEPQPESRSLRAERATAFTPVHAPELLCSSPDPMAHADAGQTAANSAFWEIEAGSIQDEPAAYDPPAHDVVRRHELPGVAGATAEPEDVVKPIYANLIEFPRPMVAARRARPRLAEGPLANSDFAPQLSIFEVDPAAISTAPPLPTEDPSAPPSWMRTEWPASAADERLPKLDSDVMPLARHSEFAASVVDLGAPFTSAGVAAHPGLDAQTWEEFTAGFWSDAEVATQSVSAPTITVAPLSRRLLAVVVDGALSAALLVLGAFLAVSYVGQLPGVRVFALGAALTFLVAGFAYHACFFTLFRSTPGMWYAGIEINAASGSVPGLKRRWLRLLAMLLSLLPLGLGYIWALFDDKNLAWHDRLSGTYLRRR